jgi:hypothetical protein
MSELAGGQGNAAKLSGLSRVQISRLANGHRTSINQHTLNGSQTLLEELIRKRKVSAADRDAEWLAFRHALDEPRSVRDIAAGHRESAEARLSALRQSPAAEADFESLCSQVRRQCGPLLQRVVSACEGAGEGEAYSRVLLSRALRPLLEGLFDPIEMHWTECLLPPMHQYRRGSRRRLSAWAVSLIRRRIAAELTVLKARGSLKNRITLAMARAQPPELGIPAATLRVMMHNFLLASADIDEGRSPTVHPLTG